MTLLFILIVLIVALLVVYLISTARFQQIVHREVDTLFHSAHAFRGVYRESLIEGLPEPVQRYFRNNIREGAPLIDAARLKQEGQLRTSPQQAWLDVQAQQYFTVMPSGFIWYVSTRLMALPVIGRDAYYEGTGSMKIRLLSLIPIVNITNNDEINQAGLARYAAELMWMPTALLPREGLRWEAIDTTHARLIFCDHGIEITLTVTFAEKGEIVKVTAPRLLNGTFEQWGGEVEAYQWFGDYRIPASGRIIWYLDEGDFHYFTYNITDVEYNVPERYS